MRGRFTWSTCLAPAERAGCVCYSAPVDTARVGGWSRSIAVWVASAPGGSGQLGDGDEGAVKWTAVAGGALTVSGFCRPLVAEGQKKGWGFHYGLATCAFVLALLAKPSAVAVPVVAWVLDCGILKRSWRQSAKSLGGWVVLALVFVGVTKAAQSTVQVDFTSSLWARLLIAAAVFAAALLPVLGLIPFGFQQISTVADRCVYLSLLGPALALAFALSVPMEEHGNDPGGLHRRGCVGVAQRCPGPILS